MVVFEEKVLKSKIMGVMGAAIVSVMMSRSLERIGPCHLTAAGARGSGWFPKVSRQLVNNSHAFWSSGV